QHDCVTDQVIHVDFKRISLTEKVKVSVPLIPKGDPIGVKQGGGSLDHILWELDIICLPMDIPEGIEVDVSHLQVNESIHLKDVVLPKGVETKHDVEAIVFSVAPPMKEEAPVEVPAGAEPEVIQKEKPAKEGDAAPAAGSAPAAQTKK
ncbi:MAG TPA: 50S ribosomal protein L25, partial [Candidatus Bathyarchaeia archaeon]|nr:50S ribosomal protein L25 [Candidatus Bathyarchaeia archaeon]